MVTKLQGGDPSPGLAEVSTIQVLEVRGARGVVRDHHVDVSGLQRRPQLLLRDQTTNQPTNHCVMRVWWPRGTKKPLETNDDEC